MLILNNFKFFYLFLFIFLLSFQGFLVDSIYASSVNPRYYNNPTFFDNPTENIGNIDITLPVKLDWDNLLGYYKYQIEIKDSVNNVLIPITNLNSSEFIPPACALMVGTEHKWRVRGCDITHTNCGNWGTWWSFTTSIAPELRTIFGDVNSEIYQNFIKHNNLPDQSFYPFHPLFANPNIDPDWTGTNNRATGITPPVVIDWCDLSINEINNLDKILTDEVNLRWGAHFDPVYVDSLTLWNNYRIKIWEYKLGNYVPHFRFYITPPAGDIVSNFIKLVLEDGYGIDQLLQPLFFLDQNKFYLTYGTRYKIQIERCIGLADPAIAPNALIAPDLFCHYSQEWHIKTSGGAGNLNEVNSILIPISYTVKVQPLPFSPQFTAVAGANYYKFEIIDGGPSNGSGGVNIEKDDRISIVSLFRPNNPAPILNSNLVFEITGGANNYPIKLDRKYTLKINACLSIGDCDLASKTRRFKTPGAPPTGLTKTSKLDANNKAIIPVIFRWDDMIGINSFKVRLYDINNNFLKEFIAKQNNIKLEYGDVDIDTAYKIRVWSCIDDYGQICAGPDPQHCGNPTNCTYVGNTFTTFDLAPPKNLRVSPFDAGKVKTTDFINFSWNAVDGVKLYQIEIIHHYTGAIISRSVKKTNLRLPQSDLVELGDYSWRVRACMKGGITCSPWSTMRHFELMPAIKMDKDDWFGLVVCGRLIDNPATVWNERESCSIKHIPIMASVIINFILWDVVPLLGFLLLIFTAFLYYTAFAQAEAVGQVTSKVKRMWKFFAIGWILLFFGFTIINGFLQIIGVNVNLFGEWYQ